jgi:acylphosphatase
VQGVGFRRFVEWRARSLGLAGWVLNREDGSVEIAAEGDPATIEAFRQEVRRGPPGARVAQVADLHVADDEPLPNPFRVRRS